MDLALTSAVGLRDQQSDVAYERERERERVCVCVLATRKSCLRDVVTPDKKATRATRKKERKYSHRPHPRSQCIIPGASSPLATPNNKVNGK